MEDWVKQLRGSPVAARVVPFVAVVVLTFGQGQFGEESRYWLYAIKMVLGAGLVWVTWPLVTEMRWRFSWEAVVAGVAVFVVWVGLEGLYPKLGSAGTPWNPNAHFGDGAALAWCFILVRIVGSSLVVPPIEEVFYRSFLYRWIENPRIEEVPLGRFGWKPFVGASVVFGLAHAEWLPGILCGMAYQWLVCRKKRLGDAMTAHAITNLLLGIWVVTRGQWQFW